MLVTAEPADTSAGLRQLSDHVVTGIMTLYIQNCRGYTATISGLVMLPGAIAQAIAQFFGGRALDRFGARPVAMVGTIQCR